MKLVNLTKNEFKKYADNHKQITFHQTEEWANLKKVNGWKPYYIGLKEDEKIKCCLCMEHAGIIKKTVDNKYKSFRKSNRNKS